MTENETAPQREAQEPQSKRLVARVVEQLLDPDNIRTSIMVLGMLAIAAVLFGMFGNGSRFLILLKDAEISRGLITFLVALTTVLLAIILVLYAITAEDGDTVKDRFSYGKEVLATLVGILGTVLGFYFGSADRNTTDQPTIADINFRGPQVLTHVAGGTPPFRYSISAPGGGFAKIEARLSKDGWIMESLDPAPAAGTPVTVEVSDARDRTASLSANFPAATPPAPAAADAAKP